MSVLDDLIAHAATGDRYKLGAVPNDAGYPYRVFSTADNAPTVRTLDGSGDPMRRFVVTYFGKTAESVNDIAAQSFAAFDRAVLPLPGSPVCAQEIATATYRDPDDNGVLVIVHTYRY